MDIPEMNDLIEAYLAGTLPPADKQAVESRIATDPDFRAEVELHRDLHEEFADPQKLQLRKLLTEIVEEQPVTGRYLLLKIVGIAAVILSLILAIWNWAVHSRSQMNEPKPQIERKQVEPPAGIPGGTIQSDTPTRDLIKTQQSPIAMADQTNFAPNPSFEDRLGSQLRAIDNPTEIQSPSTGANFKFVNGLVDITFRGLVPASNDTSQYPLYIKIYSNQPNFGQPLYQLLPAVERQNETREVWPFALSEPLRLKPGLYYFTLERKADEDLIYLGKFTVGKK